MNMGPNTHHSLISTKTTLEERSLIFKSEIKASGAAGLFDRKSNLLVLLSPMIIKKLKSVVMMMLWNK